MKLLDILLKELPKRGGWPEGSTGCRQYPDGEVIFNFVQRDLDFFAELSDEGMNDSSGLASHVKREQYEEALATLTDNTSQQVERLAWDGAGLPLVGCECEIDAGDRWEKCKINYLSADVIVYKTLGNGNEYAGRPDRFKFRLISEADRRREEATKAMLFAWRLRAGEKDDGKLKSIYEILYDAIAAGKVPGVRLDIESD